ncbi:O-antigen ligase family protein [Geoalkalibacter sp.]|uniref:O-antigen ligase family protein n=1 Tax=Geoalkalibacter sp. TaxID=3041440 RepID=UPI00272EE356|nr:O-antigen ligase family protein [Geoalkalibacter sp.]
MNKIGVTYTSMIPLPSLRWQKKRMWLISLFPLLFVSDVLYGAIDYFGIEMPITPGVIFRGMVLIFSIYFVFTRLHIVNKKLFLFISLAVISVLPSTMICLYYGSSFFYDLSFLTKVLYLPLVTGMIVVLRERYKISSDEILKYVEYSSYVLGGALLISQLFGIQRETYGDYAFGNTGIFYAQNDMTLAFGLALLASGYRLVFTRFSWLRLSLLIMSAYACVQIGTRASLAVLLGMGCTVVACVIWCDSEGRKSAFGKMKKFITGASVVFVMSTIFLYGLAQQQEYGFQQQKLDEVVQGEFPRLLLFLAGTEHISARSVWFDLFGEGADGFHRGVAKYFSKSESRRMVEVDLIDIFGGYGISFSMLIHLFVFSILLVTARQFFLNRDGTYCLIAAATLLYLAHSLLAGHALTSPIPTTLMAGYFSIFFGRDYSLSLGHVHSRVAG